MPEDLNSPYPPSLSKLIDAFAKLPGVGRRSAERQAYYFLKCNKEEAMDFAFAIRDLKKNLRSCQQCFNLAEAKLCAVCSNPARDNSILCVVEMPRDVIAIEKTGAYRGLYHVLLGRLAPTDGVEPEDLKIAELFKRVKQEEVKEVILATNPTAEGDITATYLASKLRLMGVRVTRLARGLSTGTEIEFAGQANLNNALDNRTEVEG
ncbi:MAG: recombination protein RecR [Planctomycetes bacterium]|nr:recombination protein RecR [Planctomycetota bacterium]